MARGELLIRTGDVDQAHEVLLRAAALAPTDATCQHLLHRAEEVVRQRRRPLVGG